MAAATNHRWLADEMLGRLARYLRMAGADTVYVRGLRDEEVRARSIAEGRTLLTRDRLLAGRTPGALLIESAALPDQLRAFRAAVPEFGLEVRFERCTLCNGRLTLDPGLLPARPAPSFPVPTDGRTIYRCLDCGHPYWEGHHTAEVRRAFRAVREERGPA